MSPDFIEPPYPFQAHVGFDIADWSADRAVLHLDLQPFHGNRYHIPHGGIHATLLDTAMGYAGCFTGDIDDKVMAMTLSLTVNYVGQIRGSRLIATGVKTGGGRRVYFAEGRIEDDLGNLIATGTGTFRYRSKA